MKESGKSLKQMVKALMHRVKAKQPQVAIHQRRVARISSDIAVEMGLSGETIKCVKTAALLHDIGKVIVPSDILNKPGPLSEDEFAFIQMHVQAGHGILNIFEFPEPVTTAVYQHHERMDGSGYPQGLRGEKIIVEARILAVADVVEAMISSRPYREYGSVTEALGEISSGRAVLYDPDAVDACLKIFSQDHCCPG